MPSSLVIAPPRVIQSRSDAWTLVLNAFLNTLDSPATRDQYSREVTRAMQDLGDLAALDAVALTEHRRAWVERLDAEGGDRLSSATVARHLAALRSFLRFARLTGATRLTTEVIDFTLKSPKAVVVNPYEILTPDERSRLVSAARANPRDRVMLEVALATGLRAAEICALRVGALHLDEDEDIIVHVRQGKGRKDRIIPLRRDAGPIVKSYLTLRKIRIGQRKDAEEYLFPSRKGRGHGRLSTKRFWEIVRRYARAAEIGREVSPHSLRHTTAIELLLEKQAPVTAVQSLLGHASLQTTQRYTDHIKVRQLKAIVNGDEIEG